MSSSVRLRAARMSAPLVRVMLAGAMLAAPTVEAKKPAVEVSLEGFWDTPAGRVELRRKGEKVGGVLVSALEGSAIVPPRLVLEGTFFEDNLTAEVQLGVLAPGCGASEEKAFALLLLTRSGKLTGGVSATAPCAAHVSSVTFLRAKNQVKGAAVAREGESRPARNGDVDGLLKEGLALLEAGRFEAARKLFIDATGRAPGRGEAFNGVGVTHAMRREWREAIDWYKRGLEAQPGFADLYYNLACAYAQSGQTKMALRYLRLSAKKGWADASLMDDDPDLAPVRETPEYAEVRALVEVTPRVETADAP